MEADRSAGPPFVEAPAPIGELAAAEVGHDLGLALAIHAIHEVAAEDVLAGDRAVRLQLSHPVTVGLREARSKAWARAMAASTAEAADDAVDAPDVLVAPTFWANIAPYSSTRFW